jgi:urease accessory protein
MTKSLLSSVIAPAAGAALGLLAASAAQAHTGVGPTAGFGAGIAHPVMGADHLLAMVAVGLWAALMGGRAMWLVPAAFVAVMAAGGLLAAAAVGLPAVELTIVASVIALGALVAFRVRVPVAAGMAVAGAFALFHGWAHGAEMPIGAGGLLYFAGFAAATAALHGVGLALGVAGGRLRDGLAVRAAGGAIALAGIVLTAGV